MPNLNPEPPPNSPWEPGWASVSASVRGVGGRSVSSASHLGFVQRSHYARTVGLALGFLMFAVVLYQNSAPLWVWVGPAVHCFLGPHIGWWLASRAPNPRNAERRNLLADQFLSGMWMVPMQFSLLPSVLAMTLTGMDSVAGGGWWLFARGLALQALGIGVGVLVFGWQWQPQSSMLTVLACVPLLVLHPFAVGYIALHAVQRLNVKRLELERLSQHDGLSGLFNRTHWEHLVRGEFARFRRQGEPVVLVLADLDHFKRLNDTHGHAAGDEAIRRFAQSLVRVLRETDVCGRYGGEEFGILLPFTNVDAAREVMERLRRDLHEHPLVEGATVTASFGMVELTRGIDSVEAWLRKVDQMMYHAKNKGRDRVVTLGDLTESAFAALDVQPARTSYSSLSAVRDPLQLSRLIAGLEMGQVPVALFNPTDMLAVASPAFVALFHVQPQAGTFDDIIRHCHANQVGPSITTDDIDAWLRAANAKRRGQVQRNFLIDAIDGRWFRVFEAAFSDGWVLMQLFEARSPSSPASPPSQPSPLMPSTPVLPPLR